MPRVTVYFRTWPVEITLMTMYHVISTSHSIRSQIPAEQSSIARKLQLNDFFIVSSRSQLYGLNSDYMANWYRDLAEPSEFCIYELKDRAAHELFPYFCYKR